MSALQLVRLGCWERKGGMGRKGRQLHTSRLPSHSGSPWNFPAPGAVGKAATSNAVFLPREIWSHFIHLFILSFKTIEFLCWLHTRWQVILLWSWWIYLRVLLNRKEMVPGFKDFIVSLGERGAHGKTGEGAISTLGWGKCRLQWNTEAGHLAKPWGVRQVFLGRTRGNKWNLKEGVPGLRGQGKLWQARPQAGTPLKWERAQVAADLPLNQLKISSSSAAYLVIIDTHLSHSKELMVAGLGKKFPFPCFSSCVVESGA